ncbi:MAG: hypothetical protein NC343_07510 [Muribaculum sp.]|nr:hypothetical protein [Muribaculaceae bacterium]MCM1081581.1 hypothetical protein [Muribaculum sp.]
MRGTDHTKYNSWGIGSLLANWLISVGAVVVILFSAQFVPKIFLPAVVLFCQFALLRRARLGRENHPGYCYLLPFLMSRVLFITAIVMVVINIYTIGFIPDEHFVDGKANKAIPYITILIVAPVSTLVLIWALLRGTHSSFCMQCRLDHGLPGERGFLAKVSANESRYQLRMLLIVSVIATTYSWIYYLMRYSNANMNTADKFYFNYVPLIFYLLSAVYMTMHYWSLFAFYQKNIVEEPEHNQRASHVRFLLICGDNVFLKEKSVTIEPDCIQTEKFDTPFRLNMPYRERMTDAEAESIFADMVGLDVNFELRFLYSTQSPGESSNFFHYLCQVRTKTALEHSGKDGSWFSQPQLGRLFKERKVDLILAGEVRRIYTMARAFKAYDREGKRLYNIRHYSPAFSFADLMGLKIDFNDPTWLFVAEDNEDKPLYKLRKLTRKKYVG